MSLDNVIHPLTCLTLAIAAFEIGAVTLCAGDHGDLTRSTVETGTVVCDDPVEFVRCIRDLCSGTPHYGDATLLA